MGNDKKTVHYDKILKILFSISSRLTIHAINALFRKDFKENVEIKQLNPEYISLDKTTAIADTVLSIEIIDLRKQLENLRKRKLYVYEMEGSQ